MHGITVDDSPLSRCTTSPDDCEQLCAACHKAHVQWYCSQLPGVWYWPGVYCRPLSSRLCTPGAIFATAERGYTALLSAVPPLCCAAICSPSSSCCAVVRSAPSLFVLLWSPLLLHCYLQSPLFFFFFF